MFQVETVGVAHHVFPWYKTSLHLWDFFCGSSAWPVGPECEGVGACRNRAARLLAEFLIAVFPAMRTISVFFHFRPGWRFDSQPDLSSSVTSMMRSLVVGLESLVAPQVLQSFVSLLQLWEYDFDSLDNVDQMCRPGRREAVVEAYQGDLHPVCFQER